MINNANDIAYKCLSIDYFLYIYFQIKFENLFKDYNDNKYEKYLNKDN